MHTPLILITNDDGYSSKGIARLAELVSGMGETVIVAPLEAQAGKSSAITAEAPLRVRSHAPVGGASVYSVDGTPVDCVKLAMHAILDRRPDLVLSGINHGSNASVNNMYSGTMGAAMEGCVLGIPSVGFSLLDHNPDADFGGADAVVTEVVGRVLAGGLPEGVCLNVNIPAGRRPEGIRTVRAAAGHWTEEYRDYSTPSGRPFYWLTGKFHNLEPDNPETDEYWLARGWATA
ncbi:MAG: 5'/3'-nucleotidase SurE, partial [Duncaniella sp.]|nr:5'/3'-nucleotidase SurE [Duncaniella sp.]